MCGEYDGNEAMFVTLLSPVFVHISVCGTMFVVVCFKPLGRLLAAASALLPSFVSNGRVMLIKRGLFLWVLSPLPLLLFLASSTCLFLVNTSIHN